MTRHGKIARLPVKIRDELNLRLENGEAGVRLVEWLNGLPEVNAVLKEHFEGQPISECNLTQWKNGGFLDWQAWQRAESMLERWQIYSPSSSAKAMEDRQSTTTSPEDGCQKLERRMAPAMVASLTTALMAHYAAALEDSNAVPSEDPNARVERLGRSLKDMSRLKRDELAGERLREHVRIEDEWVAIKRERAELERERLELQRARLRHAPGATAPETDAERARLSHEDKAEMVRQMVREAKEADERKRANECQTKEGMK